ncbi:hypothetical protein JKP88DRAFT_261973 [Tribonema minus]|uniref:Uncharacterized protein n=1 Tax=Tribonema minus TaxID=303371 RepID=A0A835ZC77_9STRA|nr:hypothetical protein JKP88DRAFT_261973 [Tribonema minus]
MVNPTRGAVAAAVAACVLVPTHGFAGTGPATARLQHSCRMCAEPAPLQRREVFRQLMGVAGTAIIAAGATAWPAAAELGGFYEKGDELKGAVFASDRLAKIQENYTGVKEAVNAIKALDLLISDKDYTNIRGALRRPPAALLRTSSRNIIPYLEGDDAKAKAEKAYSQMISSVEKLDRLASQGIKGSKTVDGDLFKEQERCYKLGADFLALLPQP